MLGVLLLLSFVIYLVYNLLPVDKAADMAMQEIAANKNLIYAERYLFWQRRFGLDGSLPKRYLRWVGLASFYDGSFNGLLQGNLGTSIAYGKPVKRTVVKGRKPYPAQIALRQAPVQTQTALPKQIAFGVN